MDYSAAAKAVGFTVVVVMYLIVSVLMQRRQGTLKRRLAEMRARKQAREDTPCTSKS